MDAYEVAVIGGGPAGMAAATICARAGKSTVLLDEQQSLGGQIYRSVTESPWDDHRILGDEYWKGRKQVDDLKASGAQVLAGASVWSVTRTREIYFSVRGEAKCIRASRIILATGAQERPFPFPGWTLPGVMGVGAAQILLKAGAAIPDGRVVIAGTGPLLWLYAAQALRAGARIDAVLDTTQPLRGLRDSGISVLPFLLSPYLRKGLALVREVRSRVKVVGRVVAIEALGQQHVESVAYLLSSGKSERMAADSLLIHQGVVPNTNLSASIGIRHQWDERQLCWTPAVDPWGRTDVEGILVCGDGAGIGGAEIAAYRGARAGFAALGDTPSSASVKALDRAATRFKRGRAFLDSYFRPPDAFRRPTGSTIACRCEEVTAAQIRSVVRQGSMGPNQTKAMLRCGMGPCQGRMCGLTVTELIAEERCMPPDSVGQFRVRPPIKPVSIAELASIPSTASDVQAVVRIPRV